MSNDITIEDFTESLKVANSPKGFIDAEINLGQIILINKSLSPKLLIEIYKTCIKAKTRFFESLHLPLHINNLLNKEDFLVIASNLPEDSINDESVMDVGVDITQATYDDDYIDIPEFLNQIEESIIINCEDAVKKMGLNFGILDYLVSEGIQIGDLVEAGLDLCVGVEITDELKEKLEAEILKSLTDINVITLLMAAIRTEEDFQNNRLREVDISDDPAYLYTDEVLGLAISNQIAGTKATFNFKRYDEAKPGIIFGLGPMLDDIFAGLIAGCMSKIFEE
jgi:alpha-ribazole phosphatase CobZ